MGSVRLSVHEKSLGPQEMYAKANCLEYSMMMDRIGASEMFGLVVSV